MPPIDPQQLLKALGPLLTDQGGIKGSQAALQIASLMKDASKLVSKCVYLNILRATESEEAFTKFIEVGGWDTLNAWLDMARNENNSPLLKELLEVYLRLPVTVALLKQNTAAKTIKKMQGKTEDDKLKTLSTQLVDIWMKTIRGQNNGTDPELDADKKKKKKHKDSEKDKEKDHEKDKDKNHKDSKKSKDEKEHSDRHKNRDKDSKEKDGHDSNRDRKDRDRHKDKDRSRRDKSRLDSKDSSSSSSSKSLSSSSSSSQNKQKETISISSSKDSKSTSLSAPNGASPADKSKSVNSDLSKEEESRRRLKTVKAIGSRIRSTGLFEEDEEETEVVKKPADKPATKRISSLDTKGEESSEKKPRLHLAMPPLSTPGLSSSTTTPPEVLHGRIKIIPPPKKAPAHEIQESNVFINALQESSYASIGMKKKKKALSSPSATTPPVLLRGAPAVSLSSSTTTPATATATSPPPQGMDGSGPDRESGSTAPPLLSPTTAMAQRLPSVPSFYRDTLEETPESEKKVEKPDEGRDSPPTLDLMTPLDPPPETQTEQDMDVSKPDESQLDFDNAESIHDASMEEAPKPSKPKKRVSWARESQMEQVFYFEMDENERENVNRPKSFSDLKKEEMMLDRRAMESAKRFNNDTMVEVLQWKLPKLIDNAIVVVEAGCNSVERQIQMEREQSVLCALFFNKVPDTPNEPDPEIPSEEEDIKVIPLEDENGSCTEYEHTYNFNDPSSLPYDPEFGALPLQGQNSQHGGGQAAGGMGSPHGNMSGQGAGNATNMGLMMSNLPPAITHMLHVLKQQAQDTRDPVLQNLQGMLTNVLQTTNPQDSGMLVDRILNALEPFMHQIPGLSNLINSVKGNGGMDFPAGGGGGGGPGNRFMGHPAGPGGPMGGGNPRHGLLGSAPPGYNMEGGGGGGNMRPPLGMPSGPMSMMNNGGGKYYGGGGGGMQMGGPPPGHWRGGGGGRSRPFKRGGHRGNTVCMFFAKTRTCKFGDNCQYLHPNT
ncbi:serine/threonine-protein phosphatase 1 regulatory subunit 10 [Elysia marginata]|uniref:Serine/threonine-protein phosphatase 1 regulatory subunit 10 n=1 Tax=Elysia marginata TaxID=1093978 RepID=A0AAV4GI72_9GAST|nr:serine/threonine-protein phosphatase 1 regulatory subunit 10 [Elysia marginata]